MTNDEIFAGWSTNLRDFISENHYPLDRPAFVCGTKWAEKRMYWNARKAFCKSVCPNGCPQTKDDIEGGGGLAVNCDKLKNFVESLKQISNL